VSTVDISLDPARWTATSVAQALGRREVSPVEVLDTALARIAALDGAIGAFVQVLPERARVQALAAEARLAHGVPRGPLDGVPVAVKDLGERVEGVATTLGCPHVALPPAASSTILIERMEAAGCVVVGTTNVPELGHRCTTDNRLHGVTSSPFAPGVLNAGGSSGGSAAAVAAGMVPVAIGSDGAGSIRVPAALCGVVGLKPTFGRVPNAPRPNGFRNSALFVSAGPLTRTVADAGLLLDVLAGPHPADPFCLPASAERRLVLGDRLPLPDRPLRIGLSFDLGGFPVDADVADAVAAAAAALEDTGRCEVRPCGFRLPVSHADLTGVVRRAVGSTLADTVAGLVARGALLHEPEATLEPPVQALIEEFMDAPPDVWRRDGLVRTLLLDEIERTLTGFDLLLTPVTSVVSVPNALAGPTMGPAAVNGHPVDPLLGWCATWPFNLTGHPAVAVPAARVGAAPVGVQLVGGRFADRLVLAAAEALESAAPWHGWYSDIDVKEALPCPS